MTIRDWIKDREIVGKPTFSIADVRESFPDTSSSTIYTELNRLSKQLVIVPVYKRFYTIMPIQYVARRVVPPLYYIDQLMKYLNKPYYISLLSAAELHGAAHQRSQRFSVTTIRPQVTTSKQKNNILVWNYRIKISQKLLCQKNSETGIIKYSSAELTAVDLIQYEHLIGGLSVAATVLEELLECTDFSKNFIELLSATSITTLQRLGYIIEEVLQEQEQADILFNLLSENKKRLKYIPLASSLPFEGFKSDNRWKIIINQTIEPDDL